MANFKLELPATVTFDYPTITALAGYLASKIVSDSDRQALARVGKGPTAAEAGHGMSFTKIVGISSSVAASGVKDRGRPTDYTHHSPENVQLSNLCTASGITGKHTLCCLRYAKRVSELFGTFETHEE